MRSMILHENGLKTWTLVFDKGDELMATLTVSPSANRSAPRISPRSVRSARRCAGDIALEADSPKVHAHVVVGKSDGTAHGGHVLSARVWPTLELVLTESPQALVRRSDPATGLALLDLGGRRGAGVAPDRGSTPGAGVPPRPPWSSSDE